MRSHQIVLSEVAYLLRSCEYLIGALQDVESAAGRLADLGRFRTRCPNRRRSMRSAVSRESSTSRHAWRSTGRLPSKTLQCKPTLLRGY